MQVQTLVQASAQVITIVELAKGDVYMRLEKESYATSYSAKYGIVQTVAHNGDDAMITALEFDIDYQRVKPVIKVFGTDTDVKLFSATADEVKVHLDTVADVADEAVVTKRREFESAVQILQMLDNIRSVVLTTANVRTEVEA